MNDKRAGPDHVRGRAVESPAIPRPRLNARARPLRRGSGHFSRRASSPPCERRGVPFVPPAAARFGCLGRARFSSAFVLRSSIFAPAYLGNFAAAARAASLSSNTRLPPGPTLHTLGVLERMPRKGRCTHQQLDVDSCRTGMTRKWR